MQEFINFQKQKKQNNLNTCWTITQRRKKKTLKYNDLDFQVKDKKHSKIIDIRKLAREKKTNKP